MSQRWRDGTEGAFHPFGAAERLNALLANKIVGQPTALETIVPTILLHRSGLAPEGRPVGVFLLLGATGTGKTRTVEAIEEVLHGRASAVLRIDCGEFQSDTRSRSSSGLRQATSDTWIPSLG